ncbi:intracellular protein transport protein USO1-like [Nicotiana tomentosiformis]|uniref:intracellular protein transport protein USO1-like n=1 Tax=Nicotiana tomentosiformis TaxID=4098 RepID=UPI00388C9FB9
MAAPPNFEEGQSTYSPPRFNGQYYGWWKTRMHDFIMVEDSEFWDVICDGPFIPTKTSGDPAVTIPKTRKEFNDVDRKAIEKNFHAKKILVYGIGPDEYNKISSCQSAKEIWEALQIAHEGTTQVKQSKINMLTTEYELFRMKYDESIEDMHTRFTSIIKELHSLGEIIPRNKLVRKILSILPSSWKNKVNAITEAKDLQKLTINELVGNLKTYKKKKKNKKKKKKNLVLKTDSNDSGVEDADMAYVTKRFQKMVRRNGGIPKGGSSSKPKIYDLCHKCDLAAWGDSSSESEENDDQCDSSMIAVESEAVDYDSIFALMAQSDNDEDDDDDDEKENYVLTEKITNVEYERDGLVVVVVDLKETIECVKKEKEALTEKVASIEHERDDLLVVVVDLKDTIEELKGECRHEILQRERKLQMKYILGLKMR